MCHLEDGCVDHDVAQLPSHRRLGRQLDLFHFSDVAPGSVFWHPAGMAVVQALADLWRELCDEFGFAEVRSPQLYDEQLWRRSGHADKFAELMFSLEADGRRLGLKPMNCPGHAEIYRSRPRSHRDLPLRYCEQGVVHRLERSGNLNGVLRARQFVIDDGHVFCRADQVEAELERCLRLSRRVYDHVGLEPNVELSLRPERRLGSDAQWDRAEAALAAALDAAGFAWRAQPGEGAFYGPKVDMHLDDRMGRSWQLATVQLDLQLPERLDLSYRDERNELVRPVLVHRASFGSFERFVGLLVDRLDGWLPPWLAPIAVQVLPVSARHDEIACELVDRLCASGVRAQRADGSSRLGRRIALAREQRVPYVVVVGDEEAAAGDVAVQRAGAAEQVRMPADRFVRDVAEVVRERVA